jgi:hypothetical protein
LYESCCDDYADRLEEEGYAEGTACFGFNESGVRKEEATHQEAKYGGKRFSPAIGMVYGLTGGTEGEEYGIS